MCGNKGILGLAYAALALPHTDAFADKLAAAADVDLFAVQLCQQNGRLWFGGYDPSVAVGAPVFTRLVDRSSYMVRLEGIAVGDVPVPLHGGTAPLPPLGSLSHNSGRSPARRAVAAVVDTGTTLFAVPKDVLAAVSDALDGDDRFRAIFGTGFLLRSPGRCFAAPGHTTDALNALLPRLHVVLDGVTLDMSAVSSYLMQLVRGGITYYCPGVGVASTSSSGFILGWSVLNQFLTVFDRANGRIGFAALAPSCCT